MKASALRSAFNGLHASGQPEAEQPTAHLAVHEHGCLLGIDMSAFFSAPPRGHVVPAVPRGLGFPGRPSLPDISIREPGYLLKNPCTDILIRKLIDALPADVLDRFHRNMDRLEFISLDSTFTSMNTGAGVIQDIVTL